MTTMNTIYVIFDFVVGSNRADKEWSWKLIDATPTDSQLTSRRRLQPG